MSIEDDVVRKAPLFAALDDAAAASLRSAMAPVKINRGGVLFAEGDAGDQVYVVVEGKLKLGTSSSDGRENLLSILGPGEMFGELSLFDPGPRTSTATAVTDAKLLSLGHDKLIRRPARRHPAGLATGPGRRGPGFCRRGAQSSGVATAPRLRRPAAVGARRSGVDRAVHRGIHLLARRGVPALARHPGGRRRRRHHGLGRFRTSGCAGPESGRDCGVRGPVDVRSAMTEDCP